MIYNVCGTDCVSSSIPLKEIATYPVTATPAAVQSRDNESSLKKGQDVSSKIVVASLEGTDSGQNDTALVTRDEEVIAGMLRRVVGGYVVATMRRRHSF